MWSTQNRLDTLARPHPALIEFAAGRRVQRVDDSREFLMSAAEHRMMGLLWRQTQSGELVVDPSLERVLATESLRTEQRHRRLSLALVHATELLAAKGIDVATFKGVAAERRWYDGVGDRPCWDVDLLVAPHSLHRAGELSRSLDPGGRDPARIQRLVDAGVLQTIDIAFEGVVLDIHFDLFKFGFRSRQPEQMWARTVQVPIERGRSVRALGPEISLIFALLHLNRDRFAKLLGFVDVLRIIERSDLDWEFVDQLVRGNGLETPHALSLAVVLNTLGVENPRPFIPTGWRTRIWNAFWPANIRLLGEEGRLRFGRRGFMVLPFLIRGRVVDAACYLVRRMFPRREMVDLIHPGTEGPYLWRLARARLSHWIRQRGARKSLKGPRRSSGGHWAG